MRVNEVRCKSILSESKLYGVDYSINPYTGCGHGCKYCYAVFMKRYTDHGEPWGEFVDVKVNAPDRLMEDLIKTEPGSVLLSSVTDAYQPLEEEYEITREVLEILQRADFPVSILTKNDLVLRDLEVLKEFSPEKISVGFTINFLDEKDRKNWEPGAPSIQDRLQALEKLHSEQIPAYLHVGPWFEGITDLEEILEETGEFIQELQIEDLNWRRKKPILKVVESNYPGLAERYKKISRDGSTYRERLEEKVKRIRNKFDVPVKLFLN